MEHECCSFTSENSHLRNKILHVYVCVCVYIYIYIHTHIYIRTYKSAEHNYRGTDLGCSLVSNLLYFLGLLYP